MKLREYDLEFQILGSTTNVLFHDNLNYSCMIFTHHLNEINIQENKINVLSGRLLSDMCRDLAMRDLSGAESLEGIPEQLVEL